MPAIQKKDILTLHEDLVPTGLNLANDTVFAVTEEKENQKVEMIDTINEVSKVKEDGTLLKDAELTVVSAKTKQIVLLRKFLPEE